MAAVTILHIILQYIHYTPVLKDRTIKGLHEKSRAKHNTVSRHSVRTVPTLVFWLFHLYSFSFLYIVYLDTAAGKVLIFIQSGRGVAKVLGYGIAPNIFEVESCIHHLEGNSSHVKKRSTISPFIGDFVVKMGCPNPLWPFSEP